MTKLVKPYGDTQDDGKVQLSFTLPVEWTEAADEAARQLAGKMGFTDVQVVDGRQIATGFSFFVLYASTPEAIDVESIHAPSARSEAMSMEEIDAFVAEQIGRKIRIAGACIGTDAHTVGIDAILNMKGYKGNYGLERYRMFETFNLGSQVAVEELARFTQEHRIDALLASQVVTQKGSDVKNFTALSELLEAQGLRDDVVLICGGPRVTNRLASELGYDAGFGRGTLPSEVASFIAVTLAERLRQRAQG
ncbi:MAG TPA: OAM dimerization domain-containing protein [Candidatus Dormibacteraeota bacterium]|nr:OAM dimerization domain-containing protein [Candidatus Dormibacteraeota bacterium]